MNRMTYRLFVNVNKEITEEYYDVVDGKELFQRFKNLVEYNKDSTLLNYAFWKKQIKGSDVITYNVIITFPKYLLELDCSEEQFKEVKGLMVPFIKKNQKSLKE